MAQETKKYRHIALDVAEEAEESFHVGSSGVTNTTASASNVGAARVTVSEEVSEAVKASQTDNGVEVRQTTGFEKGEISAQVNVVSSEKHENPTQVKAATSEAEDPLTMDDLKADVPFQKLQSGIIVALFLIVVASVLYFCFVM